MHLYEGKDPVFMGNKRGNLAIFWSFLLRIDCPAALILRVLQEGGPFLDFREDSKIQCDRAVDFDTFLKFWSKSQKSWIQPFLSCATQQLISEQKYKTYLIFRIELSSKSSAWAQRKIVVGCRFWSLLRT